MIGLLEVDVLCTKFAMPILDMLKKTQIQIRLPVQRWEGKRIFMDPTTSRRRFSLRKDWKKNVFSPFFLHFQVDRSIYNWSLSQPIAYIDQVPHTYAYTLGTYALQNEKQAIDFIPSPLVLYFDANIWAYVRFLWARALAAPSSLRLPSASQTRMEDQETLVCTWR